MSAGATPAVTVIAAGIHAAGDGYPNGSQTLELLQGFGLASVVDCSETMGRATPIWKRTRTLSPTGAVEFIRLALRNARSVRHALAIARSAPDNSIIYLRYPSLVALACLACSWRSRRGPVVVEAYVLAWDAMRDRAYPTPLVRIVRWFETRLYRQATITIVDTDANRELLREAAGAKSIRVEAIPLAIPEARLLSLGTPGEGKRTCRVLFVGTFIPLHGLDRLLPALLEFDSTHDIEFRFVGDGQESPILEEFIAANPQARVSWRREWVGLDEVAKEIEAADICLGVFGGSAKAARVLPFKLYMYCCAARPIVTQRELSLPGTDERPPACYVDSGNSAAIAAAIRHLAVDPDERARLGEASRDYYKRHLSNAAVASHWRRLIADLRPACERRQRD